MNEQNQEFDPRDYNKDGEVSLEEKIRVAAEKAEEAFGKAADAVKDYQALSPEEKKAKENEWNRKATKFAEKASDKAKELAEEVKSGAEKFFCKKDS